MEIEVKKVWESTVRTIVPCSTCNGAGVTHHDKRISWNDYDSYTQVCVNCDGEGRNIASKTTIRVSAEFKPASYHDFVEIKYEKLNGRTPQEVYELK
jgi:hypothetical protein